MGRSKGVGAYIGYGPKGTKGMVVRGLDKSPSPFNYHIPTTQSKVLKTFGLARGQCVGVIPGDKQADKVVPGPGAYQKEILVRPKSLNAKSGTSAFVWGSSQGREERGSILENPRKAFPAPNSYQINNDLTSITTRRLEDAIIQSKRFAA